MLTLKLYKINMSDMDLGGVSQKHRKLIVDPLPPVRFMNAFGKRCPGLLTSNPGVKAQFRVHSTDSKAPKRKAHKTGSLWICKVREEMLFGLTEGKAEIRCGRYIKKCFSQEHKVTSYT